MSNAPVNLVISTAKKELKQFIEEEKRKRGLPSYLMASIMAEVLAELRSDEMDELIDAIVTTEPEKGCETQ